MRSPRYYLLVAAFIPVTALAASPPLPAEGVKNEISAALGISVKPAAGSGGYTEAPRKPAVEKNEEKVILKRKSMVRRQSVGKTADPEPAPGERLTMRQVMELLKTTRNFAGKNLSGLRLIGLDLARCNLKGADLSNANLERANLEEANLELADLSNANMRMTDLRITGLKGARLDRTILDGAIWPDGTICAKGSVGACRENGVSYASQ